jgi:hypothetical protein
MKIIFINSINWLLDDVKVLEALLLWKSIKFKER